MTAPRLATIPFEHVEAELAAFPLSSEASFRLGTTSLNPQVSHGANDRLWRATERVVLNALPSIPLDEAVTIRDKLWFDSYSLDQDTLSLLDQDTLRLDERISEPVSLGKYLQRLARDYLEPDGHAKVVTFGTGGRERGRLRWSWMCQALPPDLLRVAGNIVKADGDPFPPESAMQKMLDRGFAETHLHLGAALDFSLAWAALMRALTCNESTHSDFESAGACFDNGRDLNSWVLHAAVVRLILADWLFNGSAQATSSSADLLRFAYDRPGRRLDLTERRRLGALVYEIGQGRFESSQRRVALGSRDYLGRRFAQTRALYRRLIGPPDLFRSRTERRSPQDLHRTASEYNVFATDPLARVVGWPSTEGSSPEALFISKALGYIEQVEEEDGDFARLFWQLTRIRCLLYRHIVQRPLTPGLQWFVRFFSRIKPLRKNISETVLASGAARLSGGGFGLGSLEVRLGTEESESACLQKVRILEKVALPRSAEETFRYFRHRLKKEKSELDQEDHVPKFEVGALFHFSRKRGGGWEAGKPNAYGFDHSYPGMLRTRFKLKDAGNPTGFRFARFYLEQRRHAQALVGVLQKYPASLFTFRGVDLCTDEAGVPIWVMAPLVRLVREAGQEAGKQLERRGEVKNKIPFRTSVHAGEDFVHLLTGLRRLDEAVTYLPVGKGDRLGHALALGVDPKLWCDRVGQVIQTREERLFDLIWELMIFPGKGTPITRKRRKFVKDEISRLAKLVFGSVYNSASTLKDLKAFVELLHSERELRRQGFPDRPALPSGMEWDVHKSRGHLLLTAYLRDENVWRQGRAPEAIDLHRLRHEERALRRLQKALRHKIARLGLTIEVNPSSNLLVGDLGNFMGHPLWRLRPVTNWFRLSYQPPLKLCVGSDDPLTFATTLRHEYQLLSDAIILMGRSKKVAMRWIGGVRKAGMESKFTLSRDIEQISQGLRVPSLLRWERPEAPP